MPVVLIRHADAGNRQDWTGDDHLRPLSSRGRGQANRLVATLRPWSPQRVLSSPYTRCVETVDPLARSLGLEVEITKNLAEGVGAEALALLRAVADEKVALCTHGDVIAEILVALADEDRLNFRAQATPGQRVGVGAPSGERDISQRHVPRAGPLINTVRPGGRRRSSGPPEVEGASKGGYPKYGHPDGLWPGLGALVAHRE